MRPGFRTDTGNPLRNPLNSRRFGNYNASETSGGYFVSDPNASVPPSTFSFDDMFGQDNRLHVPQSAPMTPREAFLASHPEVIPLPDGTAMNQNSLRVYGTPKTPAGHWSNPRMLKHGSNKDWNDREIWRKPVKANSPLEAMMSQEDLAYWKRINAEYEKAKKKMTKLQLDMLKALDAGRITRLCRLVDVKE